MNDQKRLLEGKVAQIISVRELAINIGTRDGVKKGMKFAVLAPSPFVIRNPDNEEVLLTLQRYKVYVEATQVWEKATICATYKTKITGSSLLPFDVFAPRREIPETLRSDDASLPQPLSPEESYVKIGDLVKEIEESSPHMARG